MHACNLIDESLWHLAAKGIEFAWSLGALAMETHCPQFEVRQILAQTRRLFVLGFSTTGGGHERITSVLLEYLKGDDLKGAAGHQGSNLDSFQMSTEDTV